MLRITYLDTWEVSSVAELLNDKNMLSIAKSYYEKAFKKYCKEVEDANGKRHPKPSVLWKDFVEEDLMIEPYETFNELLEEYVIIEGIKSCFFDITYSERSDCWVLQVMQVIPQRKKDIEELIHVFMEQQGEGNMAELAVEAITSKLQLGE